MRVPLQHNLGKLTVLLFPLLSTPHENRVHISLIEVMMLIYTSLDTTYQLGNSKSCLFHLD